MFTFNLLCYIQTHKTAASLGDSHLVLTDTQHRWLSLYIEYLRPKPSSDESFVFLTASGRQIPSTSQILGHVWLKVIGKGGITASTTRHFHESMVSEINIYVKILNKML